MPREKTNHRHLLKGWISGKECFTTDGDILYCQVCNQMVNCAKKCHIKQHEETQAHKRKLTKIQAGEAGPKQTLLTERLQTRQNPFFYDLCNLLTSCNIPWNKVENPVFKKFFADYCNKEIPSESTLRKNYLPLVYKEKIQAIQNYIGVNDIWIVVDETTDARGKYICNIIVGKLSGESPSVPCLLASKVLPQCNHATVSRFINSSLAILWPEQIYHERVRIMYSDAAAYMKKCGVALKVFYPNLYHITCLAHARSLVCEVIRHHFEDVNGLIKSVKQFFLKAPLRVQCYKEKLPNVPLPPEPILTRWGTWLEAAMFHAEHFNGIKEVVLAFDGESRAIRDAQNCYKNNNIFRDLAYIQSNFKILTTAIKELETQGDTAMQLNPVLWTEPLVTDRDQFKESSTNDADEEEESSSTSFTQQQQNPTFEILEPNHSFLYSTILARNLQQVTKTAFLNLSLATTTEIAEDASVDVILQSDGETKEICSSHNSVEDEKPTHKRTTPCKRISYKIKRSSSGYRKLNNRNPIRGSTVAELASKFDKLCSEKKYILDDPKFAQIIKRVNSQNYSQGDAGKINRKSSVKMSIEEKSSRKPSSRQNSNNNNNDEATSQNSDHGINVRAAIKIFEDRQVNDTKNLQLKPRIPEKKMFTKSLEVIPNNIGDFSENDREKDDFDEVPVLIVNIEKTIRSESAYEMSHVKLKNKISKSLRNGLEEVKSTSAALSKVSEEDNNLYDLVVPPSLAKPVVDKKIQPPVPPKPKNIENRRIVKKKTVETIDQIGKNPNLFEGNKSEGLEDLPSRIDRISESINEKALKIIEQEKAYEELSVPPSEATHSYEDIEQKSDDGYEAIIPLNLLEQNIYETLPSVRDCPPPLPKRQEELLPPKLPAKNSYYKVHHSQDETNSYEIIDTCNIFRTNVVSEVSSESSYDTLMQLKFNCNSNRASVISCDQQSNSLYGRSIPDWTEDCLNSKVDSDSFSDRSDDWCDVDDNEDGHYTESIVVQKKKTSRSYTRKPCDTNSEAETDHHYESVPEGFLQNHYVAESFDSDYDISDNRLNVPYNNIDISNTQLPDTPHYQTNVLDRLSTAGKNLKRLFYKNDITKSLGRITKKKSRTDLDNLNNSLDRSKSSSKLTSDNSSTPRNSLTSQDSNSEQSYVDTNYDKQKFKSKAKSTFYLTDTIDIGSNDKVDSDGRKNSLSPVNKIKSKNSKSSPVRPSVPPPPLPKQLNPNASDNKRSTSWYVESSPFKNIENTPSIGKRSTASWYAEVGLYREGPRSTPSTSSAENSGSGISNRNEFDEINYENTEEYHNLRNETEYNNSIDSSGSNETKMDKSCTSLSEDMQHILQEEPLYQFYNAAIVDSLCHEGTDWDSDGYEEISKNEGSETRLRPSAMDLITTNGNNVSVSRTLWCEIPEVKQSEVFSTLTLDQKKLQEAKFEMMTSEASYLNSLNVLTKHFIQNLYKCKTASKEDMDTIFMKIPSVKNCSEKLLQDLEKCWQDNILLQDICNIIHRHAEENFSVYITYVENQVLLERTLKKLRDVTEFRDTLQRLETSMDCQALTLYSFLMLPMQRVTRWPLLLDAVLKRLSPSDNEYLACQYALTTINKIANQCNEAARRKEREAEMKTIVNRLDFGPRKPAFNLMSEGRWLIKSGAVTQMLARGDDGKLTFGKKLVKKPLFLFLFNDLFIVTKYQASEDNYSVIHYCPRNMIEINVDMAPNLPVKDTANRHLVFLTILENQYEKLVEILFSCNTTTDKERWLNALATAKSEDPDETLYERWDCPQVTAVYDYNVDQPDELNITKGDTIYVIRKMSDGWYYGERLRDGECGWFPANYVVEIVNPHVRARNLRQRYRLLAFTQTYFNTSKQ